VFDIAQLVAAGEIGRAPTLPSFLYFPEAAEIESGVVTTDGESATDAVAGIFARDFGALVPARQVSSAKSWLSNAAVDRTAPLLPWIEGAPRRISPVEASARLLSHLRAAWNREQGADESLRLERQSVVLTVPASFDEEARELTVQAAADATLGTVTLLEEPLAALYAWIAAHPRSVVAALGAGALVLVCDVGGGTTDFSLIRTSIEEGELVFERIAIGEHLLLGGDNLDLALAALVEEKLPGGGAARLSLSQRQTVRRKCSAAKERLLGEAGLESLPITVPGAGRGIVAGAMTVELTRDEVMRTLADGFLPLMPADDLPARGRRAGLRELGLPYESEPAITRHLAAFLTRAGSLAGGSRFACPDAVLFNGGFFTPAAARERVLEALTAWCGKRPALLENERPEASVAIGAAFYARLRSDPVRSRRLLIRAGSARAYYIGVADADGAATAVCVLPRGTQEGTTLTIQRDFTVITNQPSAFTLYSTMTRSDAVDALVAFTDQDDVYRHAPLVTALRFGKRSRRVPLSVRLAASFTETGTLELWCESKTTEHRWRLSFSLRAVESNPLNDDTEEEGSAEPDHVVIADEPLHAAERLIRSTFGRSGTAVAPGDLVGALENALGHGKQAWPVAALRSMADVLIDVAEGRRQGAAYEVRWLNLAGFCTRPGIGAPLDPWRLSELRKVFLGGIIFPKDVQCQAEWLVLWQRVAAGLTTGQQREMALRVAGQLGIGQKKPVRLNSQLEREGWRLLGSLERLDSGQRSRLGDDLLGRILRDPRNNARLWTLGRFGARQPSYGPLNNVVPAATAVRWIDALLNLKELIPEAAVAVSQIGALTGDPARDVPAEARDRAIQRLSSAGVPSELVEPLQKVVPVSGVAASRSFGDPLPEGLRLEPALDPPDGTS
jgi:molecular chaperone DnaK (HSP70)